MLNLFLQSSIAAAVSDHGNSALLAIGGNCSLLSDRLCVIATGGQPGGQAGRSRGLRGRGRF